MVSPTALHNALPTPLTRLAAHGRRPGELAICLASLGFEFGQPGDEHGGRHGRDP
jgi:hypothetical protein